VVDSRAGDGVERSAVMDSREDRRAVEKREQGGCAVAGRAIFTFCCDALPQLFANTSSEVHVRSDAPK